MHWRIEYMTETGEGWWGSYDYPTRQSAEVDLKTSLADNRMPWAKQAKVVLMHDDGTRVECHSGHLESGTDEYEGNPAQVR